MRINNILVLTGLLAMASCTNIEEPATQAGGESALCLTTRAGGMDDNEGLSVKILDNEGDVYREYKAGEIPKKITLEPGNFTIIAYTDNQETWEEANNGKGEPCYYAEYKVQMNYDEIRRATITVPMVNYGVTLRLPELFEALFYSYTFTLTHGEKQITISNDEKAYFDCAKGGFTYSLQATNIDGVTHSHSPYEFSVVESGKLYIVKYGFANDSNTSNSSVDIEIENDMQTNDTDIEI